MKSVKKQQQISITKYNPKFRNELGNYQKNEWTSISDIGKIYNGKVFTYQDYLDIETKYIRAVMLCFDYFEGTSIKITHIFKLNDNKRAKKISDAFLLNQLNNFSKNQKIKDRSLLEVLLKLRLREYIGELELVIDLSSKTEILFGFDYYMYLKTNKAVKPLLKKILDIGLFVY